MTTKTKAPTTLIYHYNVRVAVFIDEDEISAERIRQEIQSNLESIECEADVKFIAVEAN